jgi:hypothetical protein
MRTGILIASLLFCINIKAQTINNVYLSQKLTFYGYDFTHLKVADQNRIGQPLKKFFPKLSKFIQSETPEKKVKSLIKKDTLIYEPLVTEQLIETIENGRIASIKPQTISQDTLQNCIKNYSLKEKSGIGSVMIFECFDKEAETVSLYFIFFDIATRKIIDSLHVSSHDRNSYNYMNDWKPAASKAVRHAFDEYNEGRKNFIKSSNPPK